ncbi:MAG: hypothetical protein HY868_19000 [Chloroflexi bacterium]|nr:hypothetical protein [Chloroflexota bacterium]
MAERRYRTNIALEPEQRRTLAQLAHREGRAVADVLRQVVRLGLVQMQTQTPRPQQALERLARIRARVYREHGLYFGDLLAETRSERERQIAERWHTL